MSVLEVGGGSVSEFMESDSIYSKFHAISTISKLVVISAVLPSMMLVEPALNQL